MSVAVRSWVEFGQADLKPGVGMRLVAPARSAVATAEGRAKGIRQRWPCMPDEVMGSGVAVWEFLVLSPARPSLPASTSR
jgi:hypothetical protein